MTTLQKVIPFVVSPLNLPLLISKYNMNKNSKNSANTTFDQKANFDFYAIVHTVLLTKINGFFNL